MQFVFIACLFAVLILILVHRTEMIALLTDMPEDLKLTLMFWGCVSLVFIVYGAAFSLYAWLKKRRKCHAKEEVKQ